ncbi:MAG: folate family ECF transporter S component [Oscillospiraceae bacterium]|nr:folate family ECF transporter S component [Oscillospiraceae bacterium]
MKSFFSMFARSAKEFYDLRSLTVTAMFIAVSMVIEKFTINFPLFKINFAFLAIAVIGMLCGPTVGFVAGMLCDIVGWIANPDGGFYPAYTLVAGIQGLIYGTLLYYKQDNLSLFGLNETVSLAIRTVIARLLDVFLINLLCNTFLNMHYGFIPQQGFGAAISARLVKNALELVADIPLLLLILPVALLAYKRIMSGREVRRPE